MKKLTPHSLRFLAAALGFGFCLLANPAGAASLWWDNNGTAAATSGTWDTTSVNWSASSALTSGTQDYVNGDFPEFAAGSTTISALTITVNSPVTCAGMASGISGALVTTTTFSGTGSIGISSGLQGFSCGSGNTANFVFNVPLTGSGGVEQEGNGYLALYANNTYTGGTELTGGQIIYYNNNNSFGTGPIAVGGSNGALVNGGSAGITIPNNFTFPTAGYALNLAGGNPSGSTPGTTFSGNFSLPSGTTTLQTSSTATEVTEVSGIISGSGAALAVADNGTLILAGPNTYSGLTTLSSGTLQVASMETPNTSGPLGQSPVSNPGSIVLSGGTLQYSSANHNDYSGRFSTAAGQAYNIDVNGQTVAFATALTSSGAALTLSSTAGGGSLTLSAANTYSGNTTINAGTLTLSGAGDLGDTGGSSGSYAANITDNGTFIYHSSASQTLSGAISGSGALVQSGPGPLTINGADSSTGAVTISGGTLFLGSGGSLVSASAVSIAAGATFDVSAYGGYPLSSGTLSASGTASPATLNGPSGGFLDLLSLPIALTYDGAHAPLAITYSSGSGTLLLNGNTFQVNNASGLPLVAGAYPIIQTSGTISSPVPCFVDVTGSGLAGGLEALIQVNGANVDLVVQALPNNVSPVWNGADSGSNPNWSDVNNWVNQDAPFPDGDNVTFTGSTGTAPVMDSSYSVQSLTFDNNTTAMFTLNNSGSVLGVYVGVTNNSAFPQVLDTPVNILSLGHGPSQWNILNPGVLITVNNPVSDDGNGLAVSGNGTLELAGANTFTGGITTASGSTLEIDGSGDLGDNGSGSGFYAGAITNNGTFIYSSFASQTFSGPVIVNGTFTDNSSAAQTFAGSLTINVGGTFTDSSSAAQTFPVSGIVDNGMINYNSSANQSFPTFISGSGSLTVNGNGMTGQGQLDLKATNTYTGTTTVNDDLLLIGPTYGDASLGTPPSSPVANQLILNNNMNNGANNFGLVDNGGNPSTLTLSANRGIFLGANGGCISCYPGATMYVTGPISGTGPLYVGNTLVSFDGYVHVSGQSTYTGATIISGGWLFLDTNNCLPAQTPLTIGSSKQAVGYGSFFNMNGFNQTIGPLSSSIGIGGGGPNVGTPAVEFGAAGATLTIYQTDVNTTFEGIIGYSVSAEGGNLVVTVPSGGRGSTLTLDNVNTYTGTTTITMAPGAISGPTLALANNPSPPSWSAAYGAISNTANIFIGAGGTFDVSQLPSTTFYLSSLTSLSASGAGIAVGTTAAAINGASGGIVNLGSQPISLTFTPTAFAGDIAHPALYISQGTLSLNGNVFTVNNAGTSALGTGTYLLIQQASGSITSSGSYLVSVGGNGLASGCTASVSISGANVNLVVAGPSQTDVWNGGDYATSPNWSVGGAGGNWSGGAAPTLTGNDNVQFAGTTGPVPVMDNAYAVNSLTFNSGAGSFTLNNSGGSVLTVGSGVTNNSTSAQTLAMPVKLFPDGSPTFAAQWNLPNANGSITVVSNISDVGNGLAVSGPGPLILRGPNNYSGPTTVSAGSTLTIGAGTLTSGSTAGTYASALTINGTFNYNSTSAEILSGVLSGSGSLTLNSTAGGIDLQLTDSANTYTGTFTIYSGYLQFTADARLGAAPASYVPQITLSAPTTTSGLRSGGNYTMSANRGVVLAPGNNGCIHATSGTTVTLPNNITGSGNIAFGANYSTGTGTVILSNPTNNYTGATTIACGTLELGVNNALPAGTPLTIAAAQTACTLNLNGKTQTIGPLASEPGIGGSTSVVTPTINLTGALTVFQTNVNTTFGGIINGSGGSLTVNVPNGGTPGTLTLSGTNTYTGPTTIAAGTLALSSTGSISNAPTISIGAGGTFDVSGLTATTFNLSSLTTLSASGAGTTVGSTAATIKGGATVNLESQPISLTFTPASAYGDTTHPALYISQGALTLSGNTIAVNNASATPLRTGTNTLIHVAAGTINGAPNSAVTVTGSGIGAGGTASLSVSGGNVNLVVVVPVPVINSVRLSGGNLILSGTNNGSASSTYYVLTSTNVALPLSQWTSVATNAFNSGTFSVTNAVGGSSRQFFIIEIP